MLVSYHWLKDYIDISMSPEDLGMLMTSTGLEVEGIERHQRIPGGLAGIVVGHVLTCDRHPNADKLSVTTVDVGQDTPLDIVCGAPNVAVGQRVAVATVGTTLYDEKGAPWTIKKSKIRGERSEGMICAEDELHLGASHDGIMVLDDNWEIGAPLNRYIDIGEDFVFDIGLTPNRSDATCHLGVAEDVAAALRVQSGGDGHVKNPIQQIEWPQTPSAVKVEVLAIDACPRYSGIVLRDVQVGPSPEWLTTRLQAIGVRPINNVVDVTNFILHELGQPLHAFDLEKITGSKIVVDRLPAGTKFASLDGQERELHADDLMICAGDRSPMCIAGVFGGISSGVTDGTTSLFLESAHFEAIGIRRTSVRHQLRTDAAKVYEKGSDPNVTIKALCRAVELLKEVAGATVEGGLVDHYPDQLLPLDVPLRHERLNALIGLELDKDTVERALEAMQMVYTWDESTRSWTVKVPTNKADVTREVDLIEEVLRIYGYDHVPARSHINYRPHSAAAGDRHPIRQLLLSRLTQRGYHQMMNMSLTRSIYYPEGDGAQSVKVMNASNTEFDTLRQDLLMPALEAVSHNHRHQQKDVRLFEMGMTYMHDGEEFKEEERLIMLLSGQRHPAHWQLGTQQSDIYEMKTMMQSLWPASKWAQLNWVPNDGGLDLMQADMVIGQIRQVGSDLMNRFELVGNVFYAELPMAPLVKAWNRATTTMTDIVKFPSMTRDLAFVVSTSVPYKQIDTQVRAAKQKRLVTFEVFDIYQDKELKAHGQHSMAVRFVFEDPNKTMSDKEVDKMMSKIRQRLEQIEGLAVRS